MPTQSTSVGVSLSWEPFDWGRKKHETAEKPFGAVGAFTALWIVLDLKIVKWDKTQQSASEASADPPPGALNAVVASESRP